MAKSKMGTKIMGSKSSHGDEKDISGITFNRIEFLSVSNGMNKESSMSMEAENEQA